MMLFFEKKIKKRFLLASFIYFICTAPKYNYTQIIYKQGKEKKRYKFIDLSSGANRPICWA
jgi:hypothetical protein